MGKVKPSDVVIYCWFQLADMALLRALESSFDVLAAATYKERQTNHIRILMGECF